ncbi:tyrosine phosphatase IA-2 isoform 1-T4 [Glossina fuscipes fuscipes]
MANYVQHHRSQQQQQQQQQQHQKQEQQQQQQQQHQEKLTCLDLTSIKTKQCLKKQECCKKAAKQRRTSFCSDPSTVSYYHRHQQQEAKVFLTKLSSAQHNNGGVGFSLSKGWPFHFNSSIALLQVFLLVNALSSHVAFGEGNVGCKFVRTLCLESSEVCFDDNIFGKCIPTTGVDVEDIEKTPLNEDQSRLLATMLEELQGAGLGWDHPYVQCRIQGTLFSLQKQTHLPPNLCANLAPSSSNPETASPMAYIRFAPSNDGYTDRFYYPPLKKKNDLSNGINSVLHKFRLQNQHSLPESNDINHFVEFDRQRESQMNQPSVMDIFLQKEQELQHQEELQNDLAWENRRKEALRNRLKLYHMLAATEPDPQPFLRNRQIAVEKPDDFDELYLMNHFDASKRSRIQNVANQRNSPPNSFFRELAQEQGIGHMPSHHIQAQFQPPADALQSLNYKPISVKAKEDLNNGRNDFDLEDSLLRNSLTPIEEEAMLASNAYPMHLKHRYINPESVYSEAGLIRIPEDENLDRDLVADTRKEKARDILADMLGFTRHERLDVKKPGPLVGPPPSDKEDLEKPLRNRTSINQENMPTHVKIEANEANKKKKLIQKHSEEDHAPHIVDTEYAHVFVKNPIDSWSDGVRIINELAHILHMQGYFTYLTVQPHEVSFRVNSNNPERKNATDVARAINENRGVKNNLLRRLGVTVLKAGVGDKVKRDDESGVSAARIELTDQDPDVTHVMAYMFAGAGAAAIIVIFVTLTLIKRHDRKRDKLGGLQTGTTGAESCSKDYQDLCRARMAGKGNPTDAVAGGRVTSLSKENDRPPSSRSSTSSWSEEPTSTNMDISTGHMVLSYMEDHLRNKGRLQREWEALCRYEAEPSARDAAVQPQCSSLNRVTAPLPYDHSRVVLNHLANAEGLDYINASTITDHDPRTPAYVAAQGPLPTTLAHFWQMIWEQGAVVIVALCRLQENGEIACARYWPEEGAEVYHIYEVHLVSEHIWCDDYLVRSFYLKNLRTSETRTVTQFHFLSWPQGGIPAQAKALLDFRRKVNKSYRGRSCPIVVHSSAGSGRTGAYILLDLVLGRMNKGAREIDIAATLEHLRDQRADLVATRQQFEFVLMAVAEEVHAILKALPANQSTEKKDLEQNREQGVLREEEVEKTNCTDSTADKNNARLNKDGKTTPVKTQLETKKK